MKAGWWLRDYELILVAWSVGLGLAWTFIAFWFVTSWEPPLPSLDLAGLARGVFLWPAWLTLFGGMLLYQLGIEPWLAWLGNGILFLLGGVGLVAYMRR